MVKRIRFVQAKRICRFAGCKQVLSAYNPRHHCYVHQRRTADKIIDKHNLHSFEPALVGAQ